jgi:alpha-1,2-mannosyltransferase
VFLQKHFGIKIGEDVVDRLQFVYIRSRTLLEPRWYPFMTMLFQSLGTIIVAAECLLLSIPDIYCDTTGAAFSYPLAWLCGCRVIAYVHYPIISEDMLKLVRERRPTYNNDSAIAKNVSISKLKYYYYVLFAKLYGFVGSFAILSMANSSWTAGHISSLWKVNEDEIVSSVARSQLPPRYSDAGRRLVKIFPPSNTVRWSQISLSMPRQQIVLSVGQFRPEKDHALQIRAFSKLMQSKDGARFANTKLVLLGSARHEEDERLVRSLRQLVQELGVEDKVQFVVNAPYSELQRYFQTSAVGLHTMWNEHFGISVVEMMAAGLVVVAHRSAGPQMDIVTPIAGHATGFLASSEEEFAVGLADALELATPTGATRKEQLRAFQERARANTERFSDEVFASNVCREFFALLN